MYIKSIFAVTFLIASLNTELYSGDTDVADLRQLFVSPSAPMLESATINVSGGGVFGMDTPGSWRNHFRFGIGGVGELAFSQQEIFTNIFPDGATLQARSLKIIAVPRLKFGKSFSTTFSGMVRSAGWTGQVSNYEYLVLDAAFRSAGLTHAEFETRFAAFYFIGTVEIKNIALHFGPILTDFRYRNLKLGYITDDYIIDREERSRKTKGGFIGFSKMVNPSTMMIFDLTTVPRLNLELETTSVYLTQDYLMLWGLRYFLHDYLSFDSAVRYYNSKSELSDIQVKLGVNLNLPVKKIAGGVKTRVSDRMSK